MGLPHVIKNQNHDRQYGSLGSFTKLLDGSEIIYQHQQKPQDLPEIPQISNIASPAQHRQKTEPVIYSEVDSYSESRESDFVSAHAVEGKIN